MQINEIAKVCHEANRAYCQTIGDDSQPAWDDAPKWQCDSAIAGVRFHLANPSASAVEAVHAQWMRTKLADGWQYGPIKDPELKQHPCLVPFEKLPPDQQMKDVLFSSIVRALG